MDDIPIELCKAAGEEGVDILGRICKLIIIMGNRDGQYIGDGWYSFHSEERKAKGVLQLSHNKPC